MIIQSKNLTHLILLITSSFAFSLFLIAKLIIFLVKVDLFFAN